MLRKFVICVAIMFFMAPMVFAQSGVVTKDASGAYVYETTIGSLADQRVYEEIKLINNSSIALAHVTCTITINGKSHDMRPMPVLKLGDSEGFDGYFEDDMNREFPRYFGKDGKFSKKNNNVVRFTFNFRGHNDDVEITDVYFGEEDLCFVVTDAVNVPAVTPAPVPVQATTPAPAPAQTVSQPAPKAQVQQAQSQPTASNSGDTIVDIGGKNYLIHDGKAYPIQ
jgi:hypothetical protein